MARTGDQNQIGSKCKAIVALFPYAVWRERCGDHRMVDAYLGVAGTPTAPALLAEPIVTLFEEASPDCPNRIVALLSPNMFWGASGFNGNTVAWWAAVALATPWTEEAGQIVVNTLLQIASWDRLSPYIPVDIWLLLKKQPSLPPICKGRSVGTTDHVVRTVRGLRDVEILQSYLLLVWSEWNGMYSGGLTEMCASIKEDLGGIEMGRHREVLIKRLDHVLEQLDMGPGHLEQQNPYLDRNHIPAARERYQELKRILLGVDREALDILTRTSFRSANSFNSLTPPQNPTRRSLVPSLPRVRSRASVMPAPYSPDSVLHLYMVSLCHPLRASSIASETVIRHFKFQDMRVPHHPQTGNTVSRPPR